MQAIVYEKFGPPEVLQLKEIEKPVPKENEVRIKIHATSVTKYDCWVRSCTAPPGFGLLMRLSSGRKPKQPILGTELAGEIEAVGRDATRLKVGDQVYGYYLLATFGLPTLFQVLWFSKTSSQKFEIGTLKEKTEDLIFIKDLIEAGVIKPVIDRCYPMEQAAEAHRFVETGQKKGNVVITVGENNF